MLRKALATLAAVISLAFSTVPSGAQEYPTQPIRLVVPFAPGGGSDLLGRLVAEGMSQRLGQPVIVENRAGAGATIGADYVAKAKPDGYTLLFSASDSASLAAALKPKLPYRVPEDFAFVAQVSDFPFIVTVNPKLPINTLADLIAYGKANPGKLRFGTGGIGTGPHMSTLLIAKAAGIDVIHVPFGGTGPVVTAAMGGFVDFALGAPNIKSFTDSGKLRALATTGKDRHPDFPDLPTLSEAGLKNLDVTLWYGVLAPAGTPAPVLAKLQGVIEEMMKNPTVVEQMRKIQYEPRYQPGPAFKEMVVKELDRWREVAKANNISLSD